MSLSWLNWIFFGKLQILTVWNRAHNWVWYWVHYIFWKGFYFECCYKVSPKCIGSLEILEGFSVLPLTVACIIVRRLLILVHKWQSSGMAATHEYRSQHDAHLIYLPIFHGLNLTILSWCNNQNSQKYRTFDQIGYFYRV